jgi:hypothetical protein
VLGRTVVLAFAAALVPRLAVSQPAFEPNPSDQNEERILAAIQGEQSKNGPFSADLIDPLTELTLLYEERGHHDVAAAINERARQTMRANYGLHTLEQAPLLRQAMLSAEERGDAVTAWRLEDDLLDLAHRNPSDLRTAPILRELGDRRIGLMERYLGGERPAELYLGGYYGVSPTSGSRLGAARNMLAEGLTRYYEAIQVFRRNEDFTSDELRELEWDLVRGSYRGGFYSAGREGLRRLLSYDVARSAPLVTRVETLLHLADWERDYDAYERVYALLEEKKEPQETIDRLFSPATPLVLPAFMPNPLVSTQTPESTGYIDVAFELNKYGSATQIRVVDAANATHDDQDRLVRLIAYSRFRPYLANGELVRKPAVVRYYLNESSDTTERCAHRSVDYRYQLPSCHPGSD